MLSHVGTINAVEKSALALKKYLNYEIYLINVFGEFDYLTDNNNFTVLNIFSFRKWPKTRIWSKLVIYTFTIISFFKLLHYYRKFKPDVILANLVGYIPNLLKFIFPDLIVINSIQGLPKFNTARKILWNLFYIKADNIFTMTNFTKNKILENLKVKKNIFKVENPIITKKIKILSKEKINDNEKFLFKGVTFCAIGRLTRQKNFIEILKAVNIIPKKLHSSFKIIIIGTGEDYEKLNNFIKLHNLENIFLLGFKKNPYPYIKNSDYFISSSLWEEPGHAILEAGYLNKVVISSDCPNGPKEILKDGFNSIKYKLNSHESLAIIIQNILDKKIKNSFEIKLNMKKIVKNYTMLQFSKKFNRIIN